MSLRTSASATVTGVLIAGLASLALGGCGTIQRGPHPSGPLRLPGTGKPLVTIGDKNFTEQFILGELYFYALRAQGYSVSLNQNIGPIEVTMQELKTGQLAMYPEYLDTWDAQVVHQIGPFATRQGAYQVAQSYATAHGLTLLDPTPFSDTDAIGVTFDYAVQHGLSTMWDLHRMDRQLTLGGPPQFEQESSGLPALAAAYGVAPHSYKSLEIGAQYQALESGQVQAAEVGTTDAQLSTGNFTLLGDPLGVFQWGNVVPIVSARALKMEGPAFATTINEVDALLTTPVMRELNAEVDLSGQDPATVARQFLAENGVT
jgi:osmoprotectant transport system substrate-binding protein